MGRLYKRVCAAGRGEVNKCALFCTLHSKPSSHTIFCGGTSFLNTSSSRPPLSCTYSACPSRVPMLNIRSPAFLLVLGWRQLLEAIAKDDKEVSPSMLYATAAVLEGCSFVNGGSQNTMCGALFKLAEVMQCDACGCRFKLWPEAACVGEYLGSLLVKRVRSLRESCCGCPACAWA